MGAALLVAAPLSFAQAWNGPAATFAHPLGGSVSIEGPFSVYPPLPDGTGGATARGRQVARLPGGAKLTAELSRAISPAGLKVGARVAARLAGPVGIGLLVLDGVRYLEGVWESEDEVTAGVPEGGCWKWPAGGFTECSTPTEICETRYATFHAGTDRELDIRRTSSTRYTCILLDLGQPKGGTGSSIGVADWVEGDNTPSCPEGYVYRPADGVCVGWKPATDGELEQAIGDAVSSDPAKAADVLQGALQNGATFDDLDAGPVEVSGPSSVPGPSKSSTHVGPEGTTTTVIDTTYNITYEGSTVSIVEAVTTTITRPDSTVETVTEENAPPEVDDGVGAPPEGVDPCELHPDASGCAPLGVPGPAEALPEEERPLSFEPETVGAAGVCPEPLTTTVLGKEVKIDWSWTCDALTMLRPLVLALSWLGAIFWVFGIGRATT